MRALGKLKRWPLHQRFCLQMKKLKKMKKQGLEFVSFGKRLYDYI